MVSCGVRLSEVGLSETSKSGVNVTAACCGDQFYTDWLPTVGSQSLTKLEEDLMHTQLGTKHLSTALMLGGLTMLVAGCSDNHYRVTDPTSGNTYYTTKVSDTGKGGAVKVKDDKTGSMVTLQSHDVKEISENEYRAGLATVKPAPVQPAAVQPAAAQPAPAQP